MKVFISIDMEGISGLASWKEDSRRITEMMVGDLLAVMEGAREGGARFFRVADSHSYGMNIPPESLPPDAELVRGFPRPYYMMEGLTDEFDIVFLVGYHAPAGTEFGQMDHTYSSSSYYRITINGKEVGEAEINALYASELGVPVGLITGDRALYEFSRQNFPDPVRFVVTKEGVTRYAALLYPLERVREELRKGAREAVERSGEMGFFSLKPPYEVEIEFLDTLRADLAASLLFLRRTSGRKVVFEAKRAEEVLRHIVSIAAFLLSAKNLG